jgi:hypothetical protein
MESISRIVQRNKILAMALPEDQHCLMPGCEEIP